MGDRPTSSHDHAEIVWRRYFVQRLKIASVVSEIGDGLSIKGAMPVYMH